MFWRIVAFFLYCNCIVCSAERGLENAARRRGGWRRDLLLVFSMLPIQWWGGGGRGKVSWKEGPVAQQVD